MENLISKLLTDFEQGKMNRRQLVQSLALAATASAAGAAPAESKGFKAVAVNHISYEVADYKKTRDFYAELLGMEVRKDDGRQCYLVFDGNTHLIPRNGRAREGGPPLPRVDHVAYTIDPWDRTKVQEELTRRGLNPRPDEQTSFHVKDPDGFDLQICSRDMKPE